MSSNVFGVSEPELRIQSEPTTVITLNEIREALRVNSFINEGITGKGVRVVIVDTGVNKSEVPDVIANKDFAGDGETPQNSHGTISAKIMKAIAPGASIIDAKALDADGLGKVSSILEAVEWSLGFNPHIINFSLSGLPSPVFNKALRKARDDFGVVSLAAAGNQGPVPGTVGSPADGPETVAVASVALKSPAKFKTSFFSSRGPVVSPEPAIKPDIAAFGGSEDEGIQISALGKDFKARGTSFSAPQISGLVALLIQKFPQKTPTFYINKLFNGAVQKSGI